MKTINVPRFFCAAYAKAEREKWGKVIRAANIRLD